MALDCNLAPDIRPSWDHIEALACDIASPASFSALTAVATQVTDIAYESRPHKTTTVAIGDLRRCLVRMRPLWFLPHALEARCHPSSDGRVPAVSRAQDRSHGDDTTRPICGPDLLFLQRWVPGHISVQSGEVRGQVACHAASICSGPSEQIDEDITSRCGYRKSCALAFILWAKYALGRKVLDANVRRPSAQPRSLRRGRRHLG